MALDKAAEQAAADRAAGVEASVGHPQERWDVLQARVQSDGIKSFAEVIDEFLALMWCLDQYRINRAPPARMGNPKNEWDARLDAVYRGKGNWFSTLLALLLDNRTGERLRSRGQIEGFSQNHQIDLAWPDRKQAPIVCAESKVTGAPPVGGKPDRGAMADWSNRRKELKFASTDLKLHRRKQSDDIGHWDVWRQNALPKCFMLWGARIAPNDKIDAMVKEAGAVVRTYLDGAGIVAWRENGTHDGYVVVPLPKGDSDARVVALDDALWRIESEIKLAVTQGLGKELPELAARVQPESLLDDTSE